MFIPITSGMARDIVSISNEVVSDLTITPSNASASYSLTSAGDIQAILSGSSGSLGSWITPTSSAGAAYEVMVTSSGDPLSSGTESTWLALDTTRTWTIGRVTVGISTADLTVQIRRASDSTVLDTATVTLSAEEAT